MANPTLVCCVSSITKKFGSNTFKYNKLIFRENSDPSGFPSFLFLYFLPHHGQGENYCLHHIAWLDRWTFQSHLSCLFSSLTKEMFLSLHPHCYAWCLHETKLRNLHTSNSSRRPLFVFYFMYFLFGVFYLVLGRSDFMFSILFLFWLYIFSYVSLVPWWDICLWLKELHKSGEICKIWRKLLCY